MLHIVWVKDGHWLNLYDDEDGLNTILTKAQVEKLKEFLCKEKIDERDKNTGIV